MKSLVTFHWLLLSTLHVEITRYGRDPFTAACSHSLSKKLSSEKPQRGKTQGNQGLHPVFAEARSTNFLLTLMAKRRTINCISCLYVHY